MILVVYLDHVIRHRVARLVYSKSVFASSIEFLKPPPLEGKNRRNECRSGFAKMNILFIPNYGIGHRIAPSVSSKYVFA